MKPRKLNISTIEVTDVYEDLDGNKKTEQRTYQPDVYDEFDPFFDSYIVNQGGMVESHDVVFIMDDGTRWHLVLEKGGLTNGSQETLSAKLVRIGDDGHEEEDLPKVSAGKINRADFPLDKVNGKIWKLLEGAPSGQLGFDLETGNGKIGIDVAKTGSEKQIPVVYSIDFSQLEGLTISKKLEPYDKRVYIALAALFNAGYKVVSLQMIYNAMGYQGDAGGNDKGKINDSITKMQGAKITLDNLRESEIYAKRKRFKYDGSLLPMERIQAISGGNVTESAIHLFREPPVITFSRERKQITTIDIKLLNSPLSKTSANIQLEDYLIERIARMKKDKGKTSNKMLYETIYRNAGIKTYKQKVRASEKIEKLLGYYKECEFIKGYKTVSDGVEIFY